MHFVHTIQHLNVHTWYILYLPLGFSLLHKKHKKYSQMTSWYLRQKQITPFLSLFLSSVCGRWTEAVYEHMCVFLQCEMWALLVLYLITLACFPYQFGDYGFLSGPAISLKMSLSFCRGQKLTSHLTEFWVFCRLINNSFL